MRNPNGYGSVTKLSGNRRKPYMAYKTILVDGGNFIPPKDKKRLQRKRDTITDASDTDTIIEIAEILKEFMTPREICEKLIDNVLESDYKAVYKKKAIGYYKTAKEANIALAEANRDNIELAENQTFAEVYKMAYKDASIESRSESTVKQYKQGFKRCAALHDKVVGNITVQELQSVIDEKKGMSLSTQNMIMKVMHLTMKYATSRDMCAKDVSLYVHAAEPKEKEEKKPFTEEEIRKVKESGYDDIMILILTGMRISEYLAVDAKEFKTDVIHVKGTKNKTSDRLLPVHEDVHELFPKWNRLGYQTFRKRFDEAMKTMGMTHTIHETRHTFATLAKKCGVEDTMRKYMMGHITGSITDDVYTHPEMLVPELKHEMDKICV